MDEAVDSARDAAHTGDLARQRDLLRRLGDRRLAVLGPAEWPVVDPAAVEQAMEQVTAQARVLGIRWR